MIFILCHPIQFFLYLLNLLFTVQVLDFILVLVKFGFHLICCTPCLRNFVVPLYLRNLIIHCVYEILSFPAFTKFYHLVFTKFCRSLCVYVISVEIYHSQLSSFVFLPQISVGFQILTEITLRFYIVPDFFFYFLNFLNMYVTHFCQDASYICWFGVNGKCEK